MLTKGVLGWC